MSAKCAEGCFSPRRSRDRPRAPARFAIHCAQTMSDDDDRPPRYDGFGNEDPNGRFPTYSDFRAYARDIEDKQEAAAAEGRRELGLGRSYSDEPPTYEESFAPAGTRRGSGSASTSSGCAGVLLMMA